MGNYLTPNCGINEAGWRAIMANGEDTTDACYKLVTKFEEDGFNNFEKSIITDMGWDAMNANGDISQKQLDHVKATFEGMGPDAKGDFELFERMVSDRQF